MLLIMHSESTNNKLALTKRCLVGYLRGRALGNKLAALML